MRLCAACGAEVEDGTFCACRTDRRVPKNVVIRRQGVASALARARTERSGPPVAVADPDYKEYRPQSVATPFVVLGVGMLVILMLTAALLRIANSTPLRDGAVAATPSAAPSAAVDPCVVGTWKETTHEEVLLVPGVGDVRFTGQGAVDRFRPDGTATGDPSGAPGYTATVNGQPVELRITGSLTFHYQAVDDVLKYSQPSGTARGEVRINGVLRGTVDSPYGKPDRYTCTGDSMKLFGVDYLAQLSRVSRTA